MRPYRFISAAGAGTLILHAFLTQFTWFQRIAASTLAFVIVFVMLLAALARALTRQTQDAIVHMAGTVLATLYLGGLAWFLVALRVKGAQHVAGSTMLILMILLCVKFTDIGAYFGGRALGRRKLIPWLSPGKTWEGCAVGLAAALLTAWLFAFGAPGLPLPAVLALGATIFVFSLLGDLVASALKRAAGLKEFGRLLPEQGGLLDRFDGHLLSAPITYSLFQLLGP